MTVKPVSTSKSVATGLISRRRGLPLRQRFVPTSTFSLSYNLIRRARCGSVATLGESFALLNPEGSVPDKPLRANRSFCPAKASRLTAMPTGLVGGRQQIS